MAEPLKTLMVSLKMLKAREFRRGVEYIFDSWVAEVLTEIASKLGWEWSGVVEVPVHEFAVWVSAAATQGDETETWRSSFAGGN